LPLACRPRRRAGLDPVEGKVLLVGIELLGARVVLLTITSSLHVIGETFDRAYQLASLSSEPLQDVLTISVPPWLISSLRFRGIMPW
jgi:hypothetical protein